jgi:6-pyruvoyltetrahydropterin/6-carboxytetrahydropterin synthase
MVLGDIMITRSIYWRGEVSAAHRLDLPYPSKCTNLHGHNYLVEVWVSGELDEAGMIVDYAEIKRTVSSYDHAYLNDILPQPTAEHMAEAINESLRRPGVIELTVRVWEDRDSYAEVRWVREGD